MNIVSLGSRHSGGDVSKIQILPLWDAHVASMTVAQWGISVRYNLPLATSAFGQAAAHAPVRMWPGAAVPNCIASKISKWRRLMSGKSDTDNRSNQLNPNNDAYHSSRGSSRYGDDDDDQDYRPHAAMACVAPTLKVSRSATNGFGAVSMSGRAIYVTANFHATARLSEGDIDRDCRYQIEQYQEDFIQLVRHHLKCLLEKEELALFAVFDSSTGLLPWHVPLLPNDIEATRVGLKLDRCEFVAPRLRPLVPKSAESKTYEALSSCLGALPKPSLHKENKLDPEPFIDALRKAISSDAVCIGEFQVHGTGRISLAEQNAIHFQLAELRR